MAKKAKVEELKRAYDFARERRAAKDEEERPMKDQIKAILEAPKFTKNDFWCNVCKKDCMGTGYKQVRWLPNRLPVAWFLGICPNGHKMIRRITDKDTDPYYWQSIMLQIQRVEMADMLLTPDNPRFKEVYPEQYKELMKLQNGG